MLRRIVDLDKAADALTIRINYNLLPETIRHKRHEVGTLFSKQLDEMVDKLLEEFNEQYNEYSSLDKI